MRTFKDLIVWQQSIAFAANVYNATKLFPKDEIYGLTSQLSKRLYFSSFKFSRSKQESF